MPRLPDGRYRVNSGPLAGTPDHPRYFRNKSQYESARAAVAGFKSAYQMRKVTSTSGYKDVLKERRDEGRVVNENIRMRILRQISGAIRKETVQGKFVTVPAHMGAGGGAGGGGGMGAGGRVGGGGSVSGGNGFGDWLDEFLGEWDWGDVDDDKWY